MTLLDLVVRALLTPAPPVLRRVATRSHAAVEVLKERRRERWGETTEAAARAARAHCERRAGKRGAR